MKIGRKFQVGMALIELIDFFEKDEDFVEGTVMIKRAKEIGATFRSETIKRLIKCRDRFPKPKEVENVDIVLVGRRAKRFGDRGIEVISYLHGNGDNWVVGLGGTEYDWNTRARLARLC